MHFLEELSNEFCTIDQEVFSSVMNSQGIFFEKISHVSREKITRDLLNPTKAIKQAEILSKYCDLSKKKVLEIGSGFGVNHIVWTKKYGIDGYGVEPSECGFESSFDISRRLIRRNQLDASKIINSYGENLPFTDETFDIVYSTNVLEHTVEPERVLREALRVLKPYGVLQVIYPNFHSYFDGHYSVFHPPIFGKEFFPWYVKFFFKREPEFAQTLRTELNIHWTMLAMRKLSADFNFEVLSLGEDVFLERMSSLNFEAWGGLYKITNLLNIFKVLRANTLLAKVIMLTKGISPIILTVVKLPSSHIIN